MCVQSPIERVNKSLDDIIRTSRVPVKPQYNTSIKVFISPLTMLYLGKVLLIHLKKCIFYIIYKSKLPLRVSFKEEVTTLGQKSGWSVSVYRALGWTGISFFSMYLSLICVGFVFFSFTQREPFA